MRSGLRKMFENLPQVAWRQMLAQFRRRADLSKSALAKSLRVSVSYITKLEAGQRPPPEAQREAIADVLQLEEQERVAFHVRAELERADPKCLKYLELIVAQRDSRLDAEAQGRAAGEIAEGQFTTQPVPIINKVAAGYPREFTDLDYPTGVADAYIAVPDITDPNAFAFYVYGDSMEPQFPEGTLLIASPNSEAYDGDPCFVRFDPSAKVTGCTFKCVYFNRDGRIRLAAINQKYPEQLYDRDQINGIWPVVSQYRPVNRRRTRRRREKQASDRAAGVLTGQRSAAAG